MKEMLQNDCKNQGNAIGIYLRVSTRERALLGYGLDSQEEKTVAYSRLMFDNAEIKLFVDDGVSAKDTKRPKFKELIEAVENGDINVIVIYKLDRLARSVTDVYNILSFLIDHNCNLVAVMDHLDIHSANGRMLVGMLAIIAQWEREVIIERTMDGLNAMVHLGKYPVPGCPFGWSKDKSNYLHVETASSEIVNYLANMVLEGYNLNDLQRTLKEEFHITKQANTIKKWLMRSINYGEFLYHGQLYKDVAPAIMTKTKYDNVMLVLNRKSSKWDTSKYYYANRVYCSCGNLTVQKQTKKKNKRYYYYECPACYKRINQTILMKQSLSSIFIKSNSIMKDELETKLRRRVTTIDKKINKIYKSYVRNDLNLKSYIYTVSMLQKDKNILQSQIDGIKMNAEQDFAREADSVKKSFLQNLVSKVIVDMQFGIVLDIKYRKIHR